jgi:hypothetical protein
MLGGDGDIGRTHQRVRSRGEHADRFIAVGDVEADLQALGAPDPVALHDLDRIRPARHRIQSFQQLRGIVGDLEKPLRDLAFFHHRTRAPAAAVNHLLVGKHGLVHRIPVDHRVLAVGHALLEQACEHALLVHVIIRIASGEFARPVIREAHPPELTLHVLDVGARPLRRRGAVLDRRIFGRQTESIPTHRLQHILALHALVTTDHVADGVVAHMPHVQCPAWVHEHGQAIELRLVGFLAHLEGACSAPEVLGGGFHRLGIVSLGHTVESLGGGCRPQRTFRMAAQRTAAPMDRQAWALPSPGGLVRRRLAVRLFSPLWVRAD